MKLSKKHTFVAVAMALSLLAGCTDTPENTTPTTQDTTGKATVAPANTQAPESTSEEVEQTVLEVAALHSAYDVQMWHDVARAFEEVVPGVKVEITTDKNLEDVISPNMKAGNYPDVVHLAVGRPAALTETLIKEKALEDITDVLSKTIPGESAVVGNKIIGGFTDTLTTNPYNDGKTYLAPMFYGPCGLWYNAGLFEERGWSVPTTWDEMWELGDRASVEGIALFTYPTSGYFDALFYALLTEVGGPEFFNKCMTYTEGIWDTPEAQQAFAIVEKLASYTEKSTPSNAQNDSYLKNQQMILDNTALFMPNGTWVIGEMADAPRADGFKWGFTALPAVSNGGDRYSYTFFEQCWIPSGAKNKDMAKEFVAFLYSDTAVDIFASYDVIQPVQGVSDKLSGDNKLFYSIYDTGAKAAMGSFASTEPVEGIILNDILFGTVDSLVSGDKTTSEWIDAVKNASDLLRAAMN